MMRTFGFACGGWLPAGESWAGLSRPVRMVMPRGPWLRTYETASGRRGSWCQWRWADDGDAVAGLLIESGEFRRCLAEIYSVLDETLRAERASRDLGQHGRVVVGCHPVATHDFKLRGDDGGHGHRRRVVGAQHQSDLDVATSLAQAADRVLACFDAAECVDGYLSTAAREVTYGIHDVVVPRVERGGCPQSPELPTW